MSPLWAIQPGLWPSQPGLRPSQPCLKPEAWLDGWLCLRSRWLVLRPGCLGLKSGLLAGWLAGQYYKWKISPFYRTPSPIRAAAQNQMTVGKNIFRGYEMRQTEIFWFNSYSLSKVHSDFFTLIGLAELLMLNKNWPLVRQLGSQMVPNGRPRVPWEV